MWKQDGSRVAYPIVGYSPVSEFGWLRAGFLSSAYRLAHLSLPRALVLGILSGLFVLV